ncbi:MAG: iron ABC transporter substrate-binding protein [Desulfovermiculus sp.]
MMRYGKPVLVCTLLISIFLSVSGQARVIEDSAGREVDVPEKVERVYCSGAGSLRLLTYLQCQDRAVAVDDLEKREQSLDARPYALAHPELKDLPLGGEFRGRDNPERLLSLDRPPQVIFKTFLGMGMDADSLQSKTGIPVVVLEHGDIGAHKHDLEHSLLTMAEVLNCRQRAREVIDFLDRQIRDLRKRTQSIPTARHPSVFVGGVAFKGPHGFQATEPGYPAFEFVPAQNLAASDSPGGKDLRHSIVAKEQILMWDPDILFLDLATLQLSGEAGGLHELRHDPGYQALSAVKKDRVYALLPYNLYATNFGSVLANAYYIGSVLYPERFQDVDVQDKADEIFSFLVGAPVFTHLDQELEGKVFDPVRVD